MGRITARLRPVLDREPAASVLTDRGGPAGNAWRRMAERPRPIRKLPDPAKSDARVRTYSDSTIEVPAPRLFALRNLGGDIPG